MTTTVTVRFQFTYLIKLYLSRERTDGLHNWDVTSMRVSFSKQSMLVPA